MDLFSSLSIRRKLLLLLLLSIILVLVLVGLSLDFFLRRQHEQRARESFVHQFREASMELKRRRELALNSAEEMARREQIIAAASMISRYAQPGAQDPRVFDGEKQNLAGAMRDQVHASHIVQMSLYDADGDLIAFHSDEDNHLSGYVSYDQEARSQLIVRPEPGQWGAGPLPEHVARQLDPDGAAKGMGMRRCQHGIAIEAITDVVRNGGDGKRERAGFVRVTEFLRNNFVAEVALRTDDHFAMVFDDGVVLGNVKGIEPALFGAVAAFDPANPERYTEVEHPQYFLAAAALALDDGKRAYVVAAVERAAISAEMRRSQSVLLLVLGLSALIIIPTGAVVARRMISEPVDRLLLGAEALSRGDFSRQVPVTSDDEMGRLARSFNHMAEALARRERALVESEGRYRTLMDSLPLSVFFKDTQSVYRSCNLRYSKERGYAPEEIIGKSDYDFYAPELAERYRAADQALMASGGVLEFEEPNLQNGHMHVVHTTKTPVWDAEGKVVGVLGIYWDITERKMAEERLRQAAAVFESTAEGVLITDAEQRIIAVNKAFTEITGFSAEEAVGASPKILRSERQDDDFYRAIGITIEATGRWQGEIWNRRKSGGEHPAWMTISVVKDGDGQVTNYVGVFSDISVIKRSEAQLDYMAHHDPLTDLPNRLLFSARLEHALDRARRTGSKVAVLFLDLDRFKLVNDTLGHPVGDLLLREVGLRLRERLRESDTVARVGGDEFIITMEELSDLAEAAVVAEKLLECFAMPFRVGENDLHLGASIGISLYPQHGHDVATLVKNADAAMYLAKEQGRNTFRFYSAALGEEADERFHMEVALRHALERGELELFYQSQVELATGRITGAEALLRWRDPRRGLVPPERFIPLAEETGMILPIGDWVLRTACAQYMDWHAKGLRLERMAVNISGVQIQRADLVGTVHTVLTETGMPPAALELEITESVIMKHPELATGILDGLRELGVEFAVDDFGIGYSSLTYLKRFSLDNLKIDKSFVLDIPEDPNDTAIVRAVIGLAENLQLRVTAEGVETEEQRQFLIAHGCHAGQGHLFCAPLPAEEFEALAMGERRMVR